MNNEIIHFEAQWKNRVGFKTSLCSKFKMSGPMHVATTTDQTKVTCARCAKQLGITPAAKAKPANLGTCPCCFKEQKTLKGAKMVHHGYNRPGVGYIIGDCFGVKYPRYEDSCEGTIAFQQMLKNLLASTEAHLTALQSGSVTEFSFTYQTAKKDENGQRLPRDRFGKRPMDSHSVTVKVGDLAYRIDIGDSFHGEVRVPAFADMLADRIRNAQQKVLHLNGDISFLQTKIDGWVKVGG